MSALSSVLHMTMPRCCLPRKDTRLWDARLLLTLGCCGCLGLAYARVGVLPVALVGCVFVAAVCVRSRAQRPRVIDWAIVLMLTQEGASLCSSRYAANGMSSARV